MNKRESFSSRWGFICACIGSAVGMGNIWMFPTRVSLYGGGSFLIPYFIFVILIGSTGVIGEMSFGRAAKAGPIDAFGIACEKKGKRKVGEALGMIPVFGSLAMAIGYTVVMGWILRYAVGTFTGATLSPENVDEFGAAFGKMASAFGNNIWQILALVACMLILMLGVGSGIEKAEIDPERNYQHPAHCQRRTGKGMFPLAFAQHLPVDEGKHAPLHDADQVHQQLHLQLIAHRQTALSTPDKRPGWLHSRSG